MAYMHTVKDLDCHLYYSNRELSWLSFNERVLDEACDRDNPLLERLKFAAIFSSNLDEFFMIRVAGLKDQVKLGFEKKDNKSGWTPKEQLKHIEKKNRLEVNRQYEIYQELMDELRSHQIRIQDVDTLREEELKDLECYFDSEIFPALTPLAIDEYRPFPMLRNKTINLAVSLADDHGTIPGERKNAIVQVPVLMDRFIQIAEGMTFVMLEDVISHYAYKLFSGYSIQSVTEFRITRNADLTLQEEGARDLLAVIEKELDNRDQGAAVRLEINQNRQDEAMVSFLLAILDLKKHDVLEVDGPLDLTFLFKFSGITGKNHPELQYDKWTPQQPADLQEGESIFEAARKRDIFLHHPYESFEPLVHMIEQAAVDSQVLAIKQTLYRVSGDSPIIKALKLAAKNGKQVTVLVELKARFEEEKNVQWAKELELAGCHVIYGMIFLKTHSKITLIVRKNEQNRMERFVHLGTGNYNDQTAKLYTDMGIITTKRKFGADATNFFNYLSGYRDKPYLHHLSMAPFDICNDFIYYIDQEIQYHKRYGNGRMIMKMNSLTDKALIMKFYEASQAGVEIDLIVRGICCLKTGIKGVSDNIRLRSIVGRLLEHSRIYYFRSNCEEKIFLSSADMMTRNMEKRIELLFPIFDGHIKVRIKQILELMLKDNVKARVLEQDGQYHRVQQPADEPLINSQEILYNMACEAAEEKRSQ